jgi:enoyl-CoA hydratase/carnithine racemase
MRLLDIEVPVISAINGPAWRHSEIPLLCDIVLAADTAQFQDSAHFVRTSCPATACTSCTAAPGMNRGRYFHADRPDPGRTEALRLGLVAEVLPPDKMAWRGLGIGRGPRESRPCCCAIPGSC